MIYRKDLEYSEISPVYGEKRFSQAGKACKTFRYFPLIRESGDQKMASPNGGLSRHSSVLEVRSFFKSVEQTQVGKIRESEYYILKNLHPTLLLFLIDI